MHWTKFKEFADDKLNAAKIEISVFDRVEGIVGNGENAVYQHFLYKVFKKLLSESHLLSGLFGKARKKK